MTDRDKLVRALGAALEVRSMQQTKKIDSADEQAMRMQWVREAALRLMTSLAVPMEQMGPAQWSHATVATADAIWQKTIRKAQEGQGEK